MAGPKWWQAAASAYLMQIVLIALLVQITGLEASCAACPCAKPIAAPSATFDAAAAQSAFSLAF